MSPSEFSRRLVAFFERSELRPGAYDDDEFLELERVNPSVLNAYAAFVSQRELTPAPAQATTAAVNTVVGELLKAVPAQALFRSCHKATYTLMRLLERAGIWCFAVEGSLGVSFPGTTLEPQYLWANANEGPGKLAHLWLVCPPFGVVDIAAKHQPWMNGASTLIPDRVLHSSMQSALPLHELHAPPELLAMTPAPRPNLVAMWNSNVMPCIEHRTETAVLRYQPYAVRAPDAGEEIELGSLSVETFFSEHVRSKLTAVP